MSEADDRAPSDADVSASGDEMALVLEPMRGGDEKEVAHLHATFFTGDAHGHSIANLGERFMERVFYGLNADNPYFFCDVARYAGRIVGFSVYTTERRRLFRHTLKAHPVRLVLELVQTVAREPRAVASLASNMHYAMGERLPVDQSVPGWWLVAGVLPDYRSRAFRQRTGHHIARALVERMETTMSIHRCPAWYGAVQPGNKAIQGLLQRSGAELAGSSQGQGLEVLYYVKYLADEITAAPSQGGAS